MDDLTEIIKQMPKAELHLHIEGTLEPDMMLELAKRNGISLPYTSVDQIRDAYNFTSLQSFLRVYHEGARVLCTEQDFYDLTFAYLERAAVDNVRHVEISFDPQTHTKRGVDFATIASGIDKALRDGQSRLGITSRLVMCFLRDASAEDAMQTLEEALAFKDKIHAVGLNSCEMGHPPSKFVKVFDRARSEGFVTVAHAGEEGPPEYIRESLDLLQARRIQHGIRCLEDGNLVKHLATEQIPLTVCPLSNWKLGIFKTLQEHNLKQLLEANLCVSIHSDDPAYFGGYIVENFIQTQEALGLDKAQIYTLAKNSFYGSFLSEKEKQQRIAELDRLFANNF